MRSIALASVALALVLASCREAPAPPVAPPDPHQAFVDASRARVRAALRDPDSARFRKSSVATLTLESGRTMRIACGYVNAKNGFGGYAGESPWFVFEFADKSVGACVDLKDCPYTLAVDPEGPRACAASLGN